MPAFLHSTPATAADFEFDLHDYFLLCFRLRRPILKWSMIIPFYALVVGKRGRHSPQVVRLLAVTVTTTTQIFCTHDLLLRVDYS